MGVRVSADLDRYLLRATLTDTRLKYQRRRIALLILLGTTLICLAVGIHVFWPYLVEEHQRLSPWQWIPLWLGDLSALFWFISAVISPRTSRRLTEDARIDGEARKRRLKRFLVSMAVTNAIDFSHSAYMHWQEAVDFASAEVVMGKVVVNQIWEGKDCTRYYVTVQFRDAMNRILQEEVRVEGVHIAGLPLEDQKALTSGQTAFNVRVSYDRDLPARCWLTDVGYGDGDRIYILSYSIILFQTLAMFYFLGLLYLQYSYGRIPWWESLYRVLPLLITAAFSVLFAAPLMANLRH